MDTWRSVRKDVLERGCSNCGTRFSAEDAACPNCLRPADAAYSRVRGGPTSFGLPAKLAIVGVLVALVVANTIFSFASMGRYGWPRVLEVGLVLLLPIPFLLRRTRIR